MHKLTSLEAQRVTSVLDETLAKLNTLTFIPEAPEQPLSDKINSCLQDGGCNATKSYLQTLWQLEETNRKSKDSAFGNAYGNDNSFEIGEQLHNNTRTVCRLLRKDPVAMDILMENAGDRNQLMLSFCQLMRDLEAITFRRLSTTVEEEVAEREKLKDLRDKEKTYDKERVELQSNLEFQRAEKDKEVAMLGQTISKLKAELHDITRTNEIEVANIEQTAKENVENARAAHTVRSEQLKEQTDKLEESIKNLCNNNAETEKILRKKKNKFETDMTNLIAKYDADMSEKQGMIDSMTLKYTKEKSEFVDLKEHFDRVDANKATDDEERRKLAEVTELDALADKILDSAAAQIQKRARGNIDRAVVAKLKKKKGKKGKKKK